jgi:glycosyltransferase involved in cell wall biosynthesis
MNACVFLRHASEHDRAEIAGLSSAEVILLGGSETAALSQLAAAWTRPVEAIAVWDARLGAFPLEDLGAFLESSDDAWHPGAVRLDRREPDLLRPIIPLDDYRPVPAAEIAAINWRLDSGACFLRGTMCRALGPPDPASASLAGAFRELGFRWLKRGAICRQRPSMCPVPSVQEDIPALADSYRLVRGHFGRRWSQFVAARRVLGGARPDRELRALRATRQQAPAAKPPEGAAHRDLLAVSLPAAPRVSVIIPTYGRYRYVAEVLSDIASQTVPVSEVLVADSNTPADRQPDIYRAHPHLKVEPLWLEAGGICAARNACLAKATGDYIWFVDDDSRFDDRNLEWHLRALVAYGADGSVGPAYTRERPELHPGQREFVSTFMDCGTTVCRREALEGAGGFDMQFNAHLAGEDGELGTRIVRGGGVLVNNPLAKRFHYLAPVGGSRTSKNNLHRWRRFSMTPRPVQSYLYRGLRHCEPAAAVEVLLAQWLLIGWRQPDGAPRTAAWRAGNALRELVALPLSLLRLAISVRATRRMMARGPLIPSLPAPRPRTAQKQAS